MSRIKPATFILVCAALAIATPVNGYACGCGDNRPWEEVLQSDALFIGQLVESKLVYMVDGMPWLPIPEVLFPSLFPNRVKMVFEIERSWNGSGYHRIEVFTDRSSCALPIPRLGQTMLIEAFEYRSRLFTHLCVRSLPIYDDGEAAWLATNPAYADSYLLTRDSLYAEIGAGNEPSYFKGWWFIVAVLGIAGIFRLRK